MKKAARTFLYLGVFFAAGHSVASSAESIDTETARMLAEFRRYSGARLVFDAAELPRGRYHDIMLPLSQSKQRDAAEICLREIKKYPPNYLGEMGLEAIGVFAACASRDGDGFRTFDRQIGGYRYYGIWNGSGGIAAAYYSDGQLPLTFHHEIFHHIDATHRGDCDAAKHFASDDVQFAAAIDLTRPYPPLKLRDSDLARLRRLRQGHVLKGAVSDYASKTHGEDQAETARHFMTALPDALVQMAEQPELPGSQRLLHCLTQYARATDHDADLQWFIDVALGRQAAIPAPEERASAIAPATAIKATGPTVDEFIVQLREYTRPGETGWDGLAEREAAAREALSGAAAINLRDAPPDKADAVLAGAAELTHRLLCYRLRATGDEQQRYAIWGGEDDEGVNWTLRRDLQIFGEDALRLKQLAAHAPQRQDALARIHLKNLRLVARYYAYIDDNWSVTGGTRIAFESTRNTYADALPAAQSALALEIRRTDMDELARRLPVDGSPQLLNDTPERPRLLPQRRENTFLVNVDRVIGDADKRSAVRRVQPATVRFAGGSGCNISPRGVILTAAHVAKSLGRKMPLAFADGSAYTARCTAISEHLDLAVLVIDGETNLPYAAIAPNAPKKGDWICAIGQPGGHTLSGEPTGYGAFHVSVGKIRGFQGDPLERQDLGGVKHDAWTYWGHSGCPLFNAKGEIVSMHNSWDSTTAMRHGVTHEAIAYFLKRAKVDFVEGQ